MFSSDFSLALMISSELVNKMLIVRMSRKVTSVRAMQGVWLLGCHVVVFWVLSRMVLVRGS